MTRESSYAWRYSMPVNAEIVGQTLEAIEEENGRLTPVIVVEAARNNTSPLHSLFTWDNTIAAEKHRENEARYILRNLRINYVKSPAETKATERTIQVQAFPNVVVGGEDDEDNPATVRLYMNAKAAYENQQSREYLVKQAKRELESWRNRYANISEFAEVFSAIDATIPTLTFTNDVSAN